MNTTVQPIKRGRKHSPMVLKEQRAAFIFLIPAFLGLSLITYLPLLAALVFSFFDWNAGTTMQYIGFGNYERLFTNDIYFWPSIKATVIFSVVAVIACLIYALMVAMLLNRKIPARGFFRAVFYVPYILPGTAVYIAWRFLYDKTAGLFNIILDGLGLPRVDFFADSSTVIPAIALISVWICGNLIVIFLAGLQNVPRVYHEAAEIDGAGAWQRFIHVTIPCMTPIIFYNLMMSLVVNMQIVTPAMAVTRGGPNNATAFITYLMYTRGLNDGRIGYGSAVSFCFFIIIGIFTAILFSTTKMWVYNEGDEN